MTPPLTRYAPLYECRAPFVCTQSRVTETGAPWTDRTVPLSSAGSARPATKPAEAGLRSLPPMLNTGGTPSGGRPGPGAQAGGLEAKIGHSIARGRRQNRSPACLHNRLRRPWPVDDSSHVSRPTAAESRPPIGPTGTGNTENGLFFSR